MPHRTSSTQALLSSRQRVRPGASRAPGTSAVEVCRWFTTWKSGAKETSPPPPIGGPHSRPGRGQIVATGMPCVHQIGGLVNRPCHQPTQRTHHGRGIRPTMAHMPNHWPQWCGKGLQHADHKGVGMIHSAGQARPSAASSIPSRMGQSGSPGFHRPFLTRQSATSRTRPHLTERTCKATRWANAWAPLA